jgi:anthranilate phosphoribosyltransferase
LVFRGEDGLDELTTTGTSHVWVVRDGGVSRDTLHPEQVGLPLARMEDLRGGDAANNARVTRGLLEGAPGPVRDAVLLNAAAALVALEPGTAPLADQMAAAMTRAAASVDTGGAAASLEGWVTTSRAIAERG